MGRWVALQVLAVSLGLVLAPGGVTPPARADALKAEPSPQDHVVQGMDMILLGLRRMLEQVPIYGPPEINAEGDIVIRRIVPGPPANQPPPPPRPTFPSPGSLSPSTPPETKM